MGGSAASEDTARAAAAAAEQALSERDAEIASDALREQLHTATTQSQSLAALMEKIAPDLQKGVELQAARASLEALERGERAAAARALRA